MRRKRVGFIALAGLVAVFLLAPYACSPPKPEPVKTVAIPDNEIDPAVWGKAYPDEYDLWKKTEDTEPAGRSKYKRGFDTGHPFYDRLSEFPFAPLLFNGWGFGVEYNEPRGHAWMVRDQLSIDASRLKAGGVCLSCKSPYTPDLVKKMGEDYYKLPFMDVLAKIPEKNRTLGVACIDCHDNKDMSLRISRDYSLKPALEAIGVDWRQKSRQEMRSLVCAQCHVTYNIPKDAEMHSVGLYFPWQNGKWGNITIEDIIKRFQSDPSIKEWTQTVTGFKMNYIRHPEFELYSNQSVHWKAGASCADCHMPYTKVGVHKISDHRIMSPLKADMRACQQCHSETAEWLKEQVVAIQDRTASVEIRAGYATATVAKLFEMANKAQADGKQIDQDLYAKAKDFYQQAFYRMLFISAENSMGFHNPTEAMRVLGDSIAFATKAEGILRQALTKAGIDVPLQVNLELAKYLDNRGTKNSLGEPKKLQFMKDEEFKDPMGIQEQF